MILRTRFARLSRGAPSWRLLSTSWDLPSPPSSSMVSLYLDVQTLQHGDVIPVSTSAASDSVTAKASTATSSVSTKTCVSLSSKSIIQLANVLNRRSGTATSGRITLAPTPPSLTPHRTSASPPSFLADTPSPPDRIRIRPTPQSHRHYFLHFHPRRIDELDEHLLRWTGGGCDGCRGGSWASDAVRVDACVTYCARRSWKLFRREPCLRKSGKGCRAMRVRLLSIPSYSLP